MAAERRRARPAPAARRARSGAAAGSGARASAPGGESAGPAPRPGPASATACGVSSHRRSVADVRPATSSSTPGSAASARIAASRSRTRAAVGSIRSGQPAARRRALEQHEVERRVDVHRQPPPRREVADGDGGGLREPARAARCRRRCPARSPGPRPPRRSPRRPPSSDGSRARPDRPPRRRGTNASRSPAVASGIAPGAQDDQARRSQLRDEPPQARPERRPVGGSRRTTATRGSSGEEAQPVVLGERFPGGVQDANERPRIVRGLGCEDEDRDRGHGPGV